MDDVHFAQGDVQGKRRAPRVPFHFQDAVHGIGGLEGAGFRGVGAVNRRQASADRFVQERREFLQGPRAKRLHQRALMLTQQRVPASPASGK